MDDLQRKLDFQRKVDELQQKYAEVEGLPPEYRLALAIAEAAKYLGDLASPLFFFSADPSKVITDASKLTTANQLRRHGIDPNDPAFAPLFGLPASPQPPAGGGLPASPQPPAGGSGLPQPADSPSWRAPFHGAEGIAPPRGGGDPLILDLNGNGIETTNVKSGAYFDHDGNGFAEQTGWVGADDGMLVWDRDGNGRIDSGRELFGDQTILKDGTRAADGFAALAEWDGNHDGKIDANDAAFANLQIWKDANGDGYTSAGELHSVSEFNIQSLNLAHTVTSTSDGQGNLMTQLGGFTKADGTTCQMGDYLFSRDTAYTIADEWLDVSADIVALPDLQGYGNVYNLHQAMVRDTSGALAGLVQSFKAETDITVRDALFEQILFKWTGSDGIDPASRGGLFDARRLAVLEKFLGENYIGTNGANPIAGAAPMLQQSYKGLSETLYSQLMAQTHLKGLYDRITYSWDDATQSLKGNLDGVATELQCQLALEPVSAKNELAEFTRSLFGMNAAGTMNYTEFSNQFAGQGEDLAFIVYSAGKNQSIGTTGNDSLSGTETGDGIQGGDGNDVIYGNGGDDALFGGAGADTIYAGNGNDIVAGGAGNDTLYGGSNYDTYYSTTNGNDTYLFGRGSGQDTINDYDPTAGNTDTIRFAADVAPGDTTLNRDGSNLYLAINGTTDKITVQNWYTSPAYRVEQVQFADGTVWDANYLASVAYTGTDNADTLSGTSQGETFKGLGGNDTIMGNGGDDVLDGGAGNDTLYGGSNYDTYYSTTNGNDTYLFGRGSQHRKGSASNIFLRNSHATSPTH